MARRGKDDEPERPYRWADTPVDPYGSGRIRSRGPRSRRTWLTWAAVIGVIAVLVVVNQGWFSSSGSSSPSPGSVPVTVGPPITSAPPTSATTSPPVESPPARPMGTTQTIDDLQITATGNVTSRRPGIAGDQVLVTTTVTMTNTGAEAVGYSALDWNLQLPDGRMTPPVMTQEPDELDASGTVAAGGTTTGTVSFDITGGQPGTYEIHFRPSLLAPGPTQLGWTFALG